MDHNHDGLSTLSHFFPGAVLPKELAGRKSDKFLGRLVEEEGVTYVADAHGIIDPENVLAPLQAAPCTGAARGTISGGLIRKPGLVFAGADGTARHALVQARGIVKIGRCEAQIPGKTAGRERCFTRLTLLRVSDRVPIGENGV